VGPGSASSPKQGAFSALVFRLRNLGGLSAGSAKRPDQPGSGDEPDDPAVHANIFILEMEEVLARTRNQSHAERQTIFRDLQRRLHPDKNAAHAEAAKLAFQELMQRKQSYMRN